MRFLKHPIGNGRAAPSSSVIPDDALLRTALWGADMGLWELDFRTGITRWANDWCSRFNLDPCDGADHIARWGARLHQDDRSTAAGTLIAHLAGTTEHYEAEYRISDLAGRWRWLIERGQVVERDAQGAPLRMAAVCKEIGARKQSEEALRVSELRNRSVKSMTPGYIFEYRFMPDGRIRHLWASEGMQAVHGMNQDDIARIVTQNSLIDPEWLPVIAERREALRRGEPCSGEFRARTVTGETKWLHATTVPVRDPSTGAVIGVLGSAYDITGSKLAEIALHESRTTLLTVAESSADVLALFDQRRKCIFLNRPIHGLTPDPWLGASVEEFAPPEDRSRMHGIFERVINTGAPHDFEQLFTDSAHRLRCLEMRVRAVRSGDRMLGAVVNITEVTEQRAQRDTLRTQARILETMREGVVLVDAASMVIRLTNPTFERLFRYRAGELIGQSVEPLVSLPGARRKRFERGLKDWHRAGGAPVEFDCIRQDGSRFVASCLLTPLSMGGTDHWLAVINDVTERKRLQRSIIDIASREQQRIGSDLHDGLGQELTGIALMLRGVSAKLNKEKSRARPDVEDVIGLVNNAIENTRALARGLSPVSAERGGLAAALRSLAARASERFGIQVEFQDRLTIGLRLNEDDATHLYRIAQEALTNVIRHSLASAVTIGLEVVNEELHLRIEDNGRGFAQAQAAETEGLGLKLMRYRAQMLGGDLALESSASGGAVVRCACPLVR